MGKIIYLISVLKTIDVLAIVGFVMGVGLVFYTTFIIEDCEDNMGCSYNEERKELYTQKYNYHIKLRKKTIVFMLICVIVQVLIPKKEEMYMMTMVKDYEVQDIYKMTKNELKSSIDYFFEKVDELGK